MKLLLVSGFLMALPFTVAAETYECDTKFFGRDGWIPPKLIVGLDRKAEVGSVYDYFINEVHKAPIPVDLKVRSETQFVFKWKLKGVNVSNSGSSTVTYSLKLDTKRNKFTMNGRLHGYDNQIGGSGTCKVIK